MTSSATHTVIKVATDAEIAACFSCMKALRADIDATTFVQRIRKMEQQGYRLACVIDDEQVVAVAGYRYLHTLFGGDTLYVDDLVTLPAGRSRGYGKALLNWLRKQAVSRGCGMLHLDSGVQRARAHAFYFANGMHVNCFHFAELL